MRRTGQFVWGHPHASAVFSNRSMKASGSSCGPISFTGMWVDRAGAGGIPRPEPPGPSSSGTARGPLAVSGRGHGTDAPDPPLCPATLDGVLDGVPRAIG